MKKKMIFRDFSDFSIAGNSWEKKNSFIMKNEKKNLEQKNFDGLLPILWTGHAGAQAGAGRLAGCAGKGAGALGWAL